MSNAAPSEQVTKPTSKFASLALSQDFASEVAATKILTKVPIKRPHRQDFFQIHPGDDYRLDMAAIIQLHADDEMFVVMPELAAELSDLWQPFSLYTAMTRQGVCFILPVRLKGVDDKDHDAWKSLRGAMPIAQEKWTNVKWSKPLGAYEIQTVNPKVIIPDPVWPEKTFFELLEIGFGDRIIDTVDHLVVKRLRGDA